MEVKGPLYLGIDVSTQSITGMVCDSHLIIVEEISHPFDTSLPHYHTSSGHYTEVASKGGQGGDDKGQAGVKAWADAAMWFESVLLLFESLSSRAGVLERLAGISVSGQQHGTVYWRSGRVRPPPPIEVMTGGRGGDREERGESSREEREEGREERGEEEKDGTEVEWRESYEGEDGRREAARSFVEYYLAVNRCPIWLDSSTAEEVKKLEERIGQEEVFEKTGSTPQRRFSALQVAKVMKNDPNMREKVGCVSLVSSFIASILLGKVAPIDISDGSGMNILDIRTGEWDAEIGHALGIDTAIFGRPALSSCVLGNISAQFRRRYKVSASCKIVAATGDNPSSLAGLLSAVNDGDWAGGRGGHDRSSVCSGGDIEGSDEQEYSSSSSRMGREGGSEERVFISMGTSDTIFGQMSKLPGRRACTTSAHVFFNPNSTTAKYEDGATYMGLVCLSNGSLLREHLREELSDALARKGGQEALSWRDFGEVVMKEMEAKQEGGSAKLDKCILRLDAVETDSQLAKLGVGEWRIGAHIDMEEQERSAEYVLHVLIGQFLLLRRQAENIGLFSPSSGLVTVVGGAAQNEALLQLLANVFDRPIARLVQKDGASQSVNAAALGAAVRSASVLTGRRAYASGLISKVVCYPNMQIASQLFKDFNSIIAQ